MSLYDRNYMHTPEDGENRNNRSVLWALIAINAVLYLFIAPRGSSLYKSLILSSFPEFFRLWQIVTAGFMHSDFSHILFNMWGLYLFGSLILPHLGKHKFVWLYLVGVLTGNLLFLITSWGRVQFLLGASGAVCAVMMAAAMLEPEKKFFMIFMPFTPLKTSTLVVCYTILEVLMQLSGTQSHVSHLAHLGGFLGGYIAIKLWFKNQTAWDPLRRKKTAGPSRPQYTFRQEPPRGDVNAHVPPAELDALLDKVSREGINSLSEYELGRLRRAREEMRGE